MDTSKIIADRIGALIDAKGIAQRTQAAEIGISPQALSDYRNGNREPGLYTAAKLANYFGVSLDYLAGKDMAKSPDNDEIMRRLGLKEAAILNLEKFNDFLSDADEIDAVNYLLTTRPGHEILRLIAAYLYADFSQGFQPGSGAQLSNDNPIREIEFRQTKEGYSKNVVHTFSTQALADAILLEVSSLLRWTRSKLHPADKIPTDRPIGVNSRIVYPFIDEEEGEPNVNPENPE